MLHLRVPLPCMDASCKVVLNDIRFLDEVYMLKRIHSSLGYLTPLSLNSTGSNNRRVRKERGETAIASLNPYVRAFEVIDASSCPFSWSFSPPPLRLRAAWLLFGRWR